MKFISILLLAVLLIANASAFRVRTDTDSDYRECLAKQGSSVDNPTYDASMYCNRKSSGGVGFNF